MTAALILFRKHIAESRWVLGISSAALLGFGWLGAYLMARGQRELIKTQDVRGRAAQAMIQRMMGSEGAEVTTGMIEVLFWIHPFIWLPVVVWAISRGSLAVAGELERGTMDLILSRPVRRSTYLLSQVATGVVGLLLLVTMLVAGNLLATRVHGVEGAPSAMELSRPALNMAALGFCIFGATLFFSAFDIVRWRSIMIASTLTIASYAAFIVATTVPVLRDTPWETWLRRCSIFTAFNPVDAIGRAIELGRNLAILGGIGGIGVVLALFVFGRRDLPSSAG
jgi:ABC-2 type transport system permease protein